MALKVGELVAFIRADSTQFDQSVDRSGTKFTGLRSTVAAGARAMAQVLVGVTAATVGMGVAALKVGLDYNRMQQSSRAALTTLLGSAEAANAQMDKLDEFAKTSPFAKQVFIQAQQQLIGFGVEAGKVLPILDAIQNAVAAVGGSNDDISELTRIIAQVQSSGKITAETLNQLGARGVDAATLIGSQMGKTGAQIRDDITKGALGAEDAIAALTEGMQQRFGGATDNIKLQMDGAADRIKGAFRDIGSVLAAPFIDPKGGGRAVEWANKVADALRALEQKAKPLVDLLVARFAPGLDSVSTGLDRARSLINAWDLSKVNGQLDTLARYAPLVGATTAALAALGGPLVLGPLAKFVPAMNPVLAGILGLVAASPGLRRTGAEFVRALSPLISVVQDVGRAITNQLMQSLLELTPAIGDVLRTAAPLIVSLGTGLAPAVLSVVEAAGPLVRLLADTVTWISELPTPVLVAAAAFGTLLALQGPLTTLITTIGKPMVTAVTGMRDSMAASHGVAEAMGTQVGFVGAASMTARAGVASLGGALKTAFLSNPIGLAITAISTAIGFFVQKQMEASQRAKEFKDSLDQATAAVTENTRAVAYNSLEQAGAIDKAKRLGINLKDLVDAAVNPTSLAYGRLRDKGAEAEAALAALTAGGGANATAVKGVADANQDLWDVLNSVGIVQDDVTGSQARLRDEIAAGIGVTDGATTSVQGHNDALREANDLTREAADLVLSLREAQLRGEEAQVRFNDAIARQAEVNTNAESTEEDKAAAARDTERALLDLVRSYGTTTEAMRKNNEDAIALNATVREQRDTFIANATQMGLTAEEAAKLADQYGLIPQEVVTTVVAETTDAAGNTQRIIDNLNTITGKTWKTTVQISSTGATRYNFGGPGAMWAEANGGLWDGKVKTFAGGGINAAGQTVARVPQIAKGGANILWAEPETHWEAYISGKPGMRARNMAIWEEAGRRLGFLQLPSQRYADGQVTATAPPSAPFPSVMDLSDSTVNRLAAAVLAGARDVSALTVAGAQSSRTSAVSRGAR